MDVDSFAWTCTSVKWFRPRFRRHTLGRAVSEGRRSLGCRYLGAGPAAARDEANSHYRGAPVVQYNAWVWLTFGSGYAEGKR